jgi:hypothetical protein
MVAVLDWIVAHPGQAVALTVISWIYLATLIVIATTPRDI